VILVALRRRHFASRPSPAADGDNP
jgi:hypothetical protein